VSSCLQAYGDDDYLLFDCPGQIELYSHLSVFRTFVDDLKRDGWQICVVRPGLGSCNIRCGTPRHTDTINIWT
jgi:hypothetical protein